MPERPGRLAATGPAGITMVDREGRITFAKPAAERVLGLTRDEITRRSYKAPAWKIVDFDGRPLPRGLAAGRQAALTTALPLAEGSTLSLWLLPVATLPAARFRAATWRSLGRLWGQVSTRFRPGLGWIGPNFQVWDVSERSEGTGAGRHGSEDAELVRAARRGDLGAFDILVGRYQRQATAIAFRLLSNREDAMDVVQEAFLKAYDRLSSLSQAGRFGPWLLRIVSNLSLNFRRSRALRRTDSLDVTEDDQGHARASLPDPSAVQPADELAGREMQDLLTQAIGELPDMQRQALVLFTVEKLPQKEIAGMLGCSVEAVKWHVFTARQKLKARLKEYL